MSLPDPVEHSTLRSCIHRNLSASVTPDTHRTRSDLQTIQTPAGSSYNGHRRSIHRTTSISRTEREHNCHFLQGV
jgi:hypothetical protein